MLMQTRELYKTFRERMSRGSLSPKEASDIIVRLSAIMGNYSDALLDKQMAFNEKKAECLEKIKSVAKAQVMAECSKEYRDFQEIKGERENIVEMIRSLKYYMRSMEDDFRSSGNTGF